jgi:hypothetical protein
MHWDWRRERNEREQFVSERLQHRPPVLAVALIFMAVWLSGWACSALLLRAGLVSIPLRYGISTLLSYGVFVLTVGWWCRLAVAPVKPPTERSRWYHWLDIPSSGDEGCLIVLGALLVALLVSGIVWLLGGYAVLLEVAFEVAFAGTLVRRLGHDHTLGNWSSTLLRRTWPLALLMTSIVVGIGAKLQHDHPEASTIAQAIRAYKTP